MKRMYLIGLLLALVPWGAWVASVTVDLCSPTTFRYCR